MPSRIIYGGKYVLYQRTNPTDLLGCDMKSQIYTYKTIDSRVKNISPTWDQISSTEFYKFKNDSPLNIFYTNSIENLTGIQKDILERNNTFSGTNANDITGVVSNLLQIKKIIASGNDGMAEIMTFTASTLLGKDSTWITNKANERNEKNLNQTKLLELSGRIENINKGLDEWSEYIKSLSINTTLSYIDDITQAEKFKQQNVEILNTRKINILQLFNTINTNINILK